MQVGKIEAHSAKDPLNLGLQSTLWLREVLVQIFESRQTEPIFNFSLRGKHCFPYLQDHGSRAGDLRCVELSFSDFVCQLDPD